MEAFDVKLLKRSICRKRSHTSVRPLYADHSWTKDLDIVNELGGHTGCVNALSWSKSGRLLASGSDDQYLNIWEYNPNGQAKPFTLNTSVSTGHSANIFSVKFMPHSNDQTVVTCAGDSEVRVFDLEYSGTVQGPTDASASTRSRRYNTTFPNCRWLTTENTNARVYRSHADRAKRIVTESSPYLFLSCSEDGEVRQWDLRQPSSFYPPPRDSRSYTYRNSSETSDNVPPPLISYKSYGLDLNSISCTGNQPHYIALGGAHVHCFLHDRRMLGRNLDAEYGRPASSRPTPGTAADEAMREATKCVRRFAPNNKRNMKPGDHGHITACKISDARPNELISSWSGDHIYSFDLVKSPDARDEEVRQDALDRSARIAKSKNKRARVAASTISATDGTTKDGRRLRKVPNTRTEDGQTTLQVQFNDGAVEQIDVSQNTEEATSQLANAHANLLSEAQIQSESIAKALVRLRKTLFDFSTLLESNTERSPHVSTDLTENTSRYTAALGDATVLLSSMNDVMKNWTYPNTIDPEEISLQNTLRRNRQASWRFVQAAGCLSKTLGGKLQTSNMEDDPRLEQLETIKPAPREGLRIDNDSRFCYDFLKAIILWINGGKEAIVEGFKKPPEVSGDTERFPFDESVNVRNLPHHLRVYLLQLAQDKPVIDLGKNRFERDELRQLFESQEVAVHGFTRALDQIEALRMEQGISDIVIDTTDGVPHRIMDKGAAARYWGERVGRSLLMEAAEGVTFNMVNRAFGGLDVHITLDDDNIDQLVDEMTADDDTDTLEGFTETSALLGATTTSSNPVVVIEEDTDEENDAGDSDEESDEDEEVGFHRTRQRMWGRGNFRKQRAFVNSRVPYTSHTKVYSGHCNTRTVKDVNYYGLDDEYVVSGSDDGHLFIWDRKTCEIVTVLQGDGEVVNVVQGHPYEPIIACSGIDSTIKIFGSGDDSRERLHARQGINIANPGLARHSSLGMRARRRRMRGQDDDDEDPEEPTDTSNATEAAQLKAMEDFPDAVAAKGLKSRRVPAEKIEEIKAQNNAERQRGIGDAYMTPGMLARLAVLLQNGELQGIEAITGQGFGGAGGTIVVDENCSIM